MTLTTEQVRTLGNFQRVQLDTGETVKIQPRNPDVDGFTCVKDARGEVRFVRDSEIVAVLA